MKRNITATFLLAMPGFLFAQKLEFVLKGKISGLNQPEKIMLLIYTNPLSAPFIAIDSADIVNGAFIFKGNIEKPVKARLALVHRKKANKQRKRSSEEETLDFYLEGGHIYCSSKDSLKNASIKGSFTNATYHRLKEVLKPIEVQLDKQNASIWAVVNRMPDSIKKSALFQRSLSHDLEAIEEPKRVALAKFIKEYPNSIVSFDALRYLVALNGLKQDKHIDTLFRLLNTEIRKSTEGKMFASAIAREKMLSIGQVAPLFSQNDTAGRKINLKDYRGKYTLLEFWSSWCGGCRAESPHLKEAYLKYQRKNFDILSVSLDSEKHQLDWRNAIRKDGTSLWTQVSDLQGWNNEVATLYDIHTIPQNFLLDPDGKIIAKNLRGADLEEKLFQLFGD